jgi:hypothetical protein
MNVGIFLKSRNLTAGGGYTLTYDILTTLLENLKSYKCNFFFVFVNNIPKEIEILLKKNKIKYINIFEIEAIDKIKNFFFSKFFLFLKIYNFLNLNKTENFFRKNYVDFIWPLSSELRFPFSIPYIFTLWDLQYKTIPEYKEVGSFFIKTYREQLVRVNLAQSKYIITGNRFGKKEILKYYNINKNKIILNCHPTPSWILNIKKSNFHKKKKLNNFFLYPANFWSHKNHLNLIKGFSIFNSIKKNKFKLILVGNIVDRHNFKKIQKFIMKDKVNSYVKIFGFVKRKTLANLYDNCVALVYLSVSGPENLPPLEAFARGKPVLYSNFEGSKDQLKNLPIYVDHFNPTDIARGMNLILKKKIKSNKLINFAKSRNTKKYINKIFEILKKK